MNDLLEVKDGQRLSRHYYDVYKLLGSEYGASALADTELAERCVGHAQLYFNRKPLDLDLATAGTYGIVPVDGMLQHLKADYEKMAGMIFGDIPAFTDISQKHRQLRAATALVLWF